MPQLGIIDLCYSLAAKLGGSAAQSACGTQLSREPLGRETNLEIIPEKFAPGMALQIARFHEALAGGMQRRGWKIGINVPEMLRHLDLPHPGVGWLDGRRVFSAGAELESRPNAHLHVEPEVAIRLSKAVPPELSAEAARGCIADVCPALEIVNYATPSSGLDDVIGHCMFHDATVLGSSAPLEATRGLGNGLPILRVGTQVHGRPRADLVPSDLGELVTFVSRYLAAFHQALEPGDLLLSGSYAVTAARLMAGAEAVADFGTLGAVSVKVAA